MNAFNFHSELMKTNEKVKQVARPKFLRVLIRTSLKYTTNAYVTYGTLKPQECDRV